MHSRRQFMAGSAALSIAALSGCARSDDGKVRIGFVVKQPEEQWFQSEWHFAGLAARDRGFNLIRIGAADGDRVLTAIDNLAREERGGLRHLRARPASRQRHRAARRESTS